MGNKWVVPIVIEKVNMFGITVVFNNISLEIPRDEDKWLMLEFVHVGYGKQDLLRLNQVRIFQ